MSRYVDIEPLENALKAVEKRGEVAVLLDELNSVIAKYPTADVAEVRHGRWVDVEPAPHNLFYATCSVCGDRQTIEVANYCPMCGSSMDGDTE